MRGWAPAQRKEMGGGAGSADRCGALGRRPAEVLRLGLPLRRALPPGGSPFPSPAPAAALRGALTPTPRPFILREPPARGGMRAAGRRAGAPRGKSTPAPGRTMSRAGRAGRGRPGGAPALCASPGVARARRPRRLREERRARAARALPGPRPRSRRGRLRAVSSRPEGRPGATKFLHLEVFSCAAGRRDRGRRAPGAPGASGGVVAGAASAHLERESGRWCSVACG